MKHEINSKYKVHYNATLLWRDVLAKNPSKKCFVMIEEDGTEYSYTYQEVEEKSNQVANYLLSKKVKKGETVALLMENRPNFVISWLGITKVGAKVAMINTSIKEKGLVHCVRIANARCMLFGAELSHQVGPVAHTISGELNMELLCCDGSVDYAESADTSIQAMSTQSPSLDLIKGINMTDQFGFIYTSGTTGMPKAAIILHAKVFAFGCLMTNCFLVRNTDVIYTVLPLFHSAGGGLGVGMMMQTGATIVLRKKFSANRFFEDCTRHKVRIGVCLLLRRWDEYAFVVGKLGCVNISICKYALKGICCI